MLLALFLFLKSMFFLKFHFAINLGERTLYLSIKTWLGHYFTVWVWGSYLGSLVFLFSNIKLRIDLDQWFLSITESLEVERRSCVMWKIMFNIIILFLESKNKAICSFYPIISENKVLYQWVHEEVDSFPYISVLKAHLPRKIDMGYRGRGIGIFKKIKLDIEEKKSRNTDIGYC